MEAPKRRRRRLYLLALAAALSCALACAAHASGLLGAVERNSVDLRFSIRGPLKRPTNIVIVGLDQRSLQELGLRLPLPRSVHAQLLRRLDASRPRLIADDFQFIGASNPDQDAALLSAIARTHHLVLGTHDTAAGPLPLLGVTNSRLRTRIGSVAVQNDPDGVIRRMSYAAVRLPSFDVAAAEVLLGRAVRRSDFRGAFAWIDYRGPPGTFKAYSFIDVLRGRIPASAFAGKAVIVGATDPIASDVFPTPVSASEMSGSEVHANSIESILSGFPLRATFGALEYLLTIVMVVLVLGIAARWGAVSAAGGGAVLIVVVAIVGQLAFNAGWIIPVLTPVLGAALASVAAVAVDVLVVGHERRHMRVLFSRFLPPQIVDELLEGGDADLRLPGRRYEATIMFSDLRGFTGFSELLDPEQVVEVVNRYLSEMYEAIFAHGGALASSAGDGIMALFGAPVHYPDHADRALAAAREMLDEKLPRLNEWLRSQGLEHEFGMGIGLHSGIVVCGNIGSEQRLEYTAIGDAANLASRLESLTKDGAGRVYLSEATRARLSRDPSDLKFVDEVRIRGRAALVKVWTMSGTARGERA